MPEAPTTNRFDYSSLDTETAQFVQQQTGEIRVLMRRTAQDIFEIGQKLTEVKEKLGHGRFGDWLKAEFAWTERTAQQFMNVVKYFESEVISDLQFAPTALRVLAAPSIPEEARGEAVVRAQSGEYISNKTAKEIKHKYASKRDSKVERKREPKTPGETTQDEGVTDSRFLPIEVEAQLIEADNQPQFAATSLVPTKLETATIAPSSSPQEWKLNEKHWLYQGEQEDEAFLVRLPEKISLWLAFPPSQQDWPTPPPREIFSGVSLFTAYQDINLKALRMSIKWLVEYSTEGEDSVVIFRLSDPSLLVLLDQLGVVCYIAEPNEKTCEDILTVWKSVGGEIKSS